VARRAWERLGYARLADYADERVGRSARSVQDLANVGWAFYRLPQLHAAVVEGRLGWAKARLVARVATREDEARWIEYARGVTSEALSREVRKVDRGSMEANALESDTSPSRRFEVECTREVRALWFHARHVARCVHGGRLSLSECAERVAAEVLSALPIDPDVAEQAEVEERTEATDLPGTSWAESVAARAEPSGSSHWSESEGAEIEESCGAASGATRTVSGELEALVRDLEDADAFELDRRLRAAVELERRMDAQIGPLLEHVLQRRIFWALGYATRESYVRERLGLEPSWGRALLRIERAARTSPSFARAYRAGELTALQAATLVPLVVADLSERGTRAWVERAERFTLRRLRDDVERALLVRETDFATWLRTGGLPEAEAVAESGANGEAPGAEQEIGAEQSAPRETCTVRAILDADVARLLRAVLCSVRRRIERQTGRLPTPGEALGAMLAHALRAWGADNAQVQRSHAIFVRDGWRCVVPGCTSMRNLHDHHIAFRSAGGSNDPANRVTLCAFHHLRGVHSGIVRCTGRAPDGLRFALGVRTHGPSLAVSGLGDRLLAAGAAR